ncbi:MULTISPECIES: ABC transporter permease [unclassified Halomonas]|uniref:ABC transporter permease n=1 Tax=unclassified Halomonas TaxID=2609666 RepID=UPI0021E42C39|nr:MULTISPECIES: ABC transporter permease [unclassified Halomonas]UYF99777.1 ABC transporter permease [Halomonas sp. GD1P12]WNL39129.1 ABC transporter permease [Halomonas sp. PAMB 3232]WNL42479.1 ABC transporter permease [Halomonas sp. PAMB 3264]
MNPLPQRTTPLAQRFRRLPWNAAILAPLVALIVLFVVSSFASEYFLNTRNLSNVLRQVSYTGIIAIGMTFVIIAGGIDLSVGSMVALVGVAVLYVLNTITDPLQAVILAMLAAVVGGALLGLFNGLLVTRGRIAAFVVTLATMSIFRSLALYFTDAAEVTTRNPLFSEVGGGFVLGIPIPVWTFFLLAMVSHVLLFHTAFGRHVCAVGANAQVARYSGIRVERMVLSTFLIAGVCVGLSAIMLTSRLNSVSPSDAGYFYELDAIAAVVIGGTALSGGRGTVWGTVIGALILGIINNMLNLTGVSPYLQGLVKGAVILLAVLLQYKRAP